MILYNFMVSTAASPAGRLLNAPYRRRVATPLHKRLDRTIANYKQYIVTIGYRAKPGKAAVLEQHLRNRVPISRTEAGNLDYRLYRSTTDPDLFFVFSRFASEKLFDVHLYEPYIMSLLAELEDLCADTPRVETYETILG